MYTYIYMYTHMCLCMYTQMCILYIYIYVYMSSRSPPKAMLDQGQGPLIRRLAAESGFPLHADGRL